MANPEWTDPGDWEDGASTEADTLALALGLAEDHDKLTAQLADMTRQRDIYWRAHGQIIQTATRNGRGGFEQGWNACCQYMRDTSSAALHLAQGQHAPVLPDFERDFWAIVDADGLTGLPSDMGAALNMLARDRRTVQKMRDTLAGISRLVADAFNGKVAGPQALDAIDDLAKAAHTPTSPRSPTP